MDELDRIRSIKKNKKIISDTLDQTSKLLLLTLKNKENAGVMSRSMVMLEDFSYKYYNEVILKPPESNDIDAKFAQKIPKGLDIDREELIDEPEYIQLTDDERLAIVNAQKQDELLDLSQLRTEVNSAYAGTIRVC